MYSSELQLIRPTSLIQMHHFWIYIYLYRMFFIKTKIYDKRSDFDVDVVNFQILDDDVPRWY